MAIAKVQDEIDGVSSGTTLTRAFASAVTAHNCIIVALSWIATTLSVSSVADSQGNTYNAATVKRGVLGVRSIQVWYAMDVAGGATTVTVTLDGAITNANMVIVEFSGLALHSVLDQEAYASGAAAAAADSGATPATTQDNELLFGLVGLGASIASPVAGAGYTLSRTAVRTITEYQVVAAAGAYNATASWTNNATWICQIVTFIAPVPATVSAVVAEATGAAAESAFDAKANVAGVVAGASGAALAAALTAKATVAGALATAVLRAQAPRVTGNETGYEALLAAASAVSAEPAIQLLVDWAGEGFGNEASWTDETDYLISARGEMASTGTRKTLTMLGQGVVSVAYATLYNEVVSGTGARFSPSNASGPLYAYIGSGKLRMTRCRLNAGYCVGSNLLLNSSFETAGLGGADVFGDWGEAAGLGGTISRNATARDGSYACLIVPGAISDAEVYQQVPVVAARQYRLTFWTRGYGGATGWYSVYDDTNGANIIAPKSCAVTGSTYTKVTACFTAPASCINATVHLWALSSTTGAYFDWVSVQCCEMVPQITGYIVDSKEDYKARTATFEIRDRAAALALMRASTAVYENHSVAELVAHILALQDRDPFGTTEVDTGIAYHRYAWLDEDQDTLWGLLGTLAEAHGGRIWVDRSGVLMFEDMMHPVKPHSDNYKNPLVSQATYAVSDFAACDPRYDSGAVINDVELSYSPLYAAPAQVVYEASEIYTIQPGGGTLEVEAQLDAPCLSLEAPDLAAVTGGRTDISADVAVVVTSSTAVAAVLTLTNNNADYVAFVTMLQLRGVPLLAAEPIKVKLEDSASITQYGRQSWKASNAYIRAAAHAEALAAHILSRFATAPLTITLRGLVCLPYLEPGNRVTVEESDLGLDEDFFITKLAWTWWPAFTMNLDLVRAADIYPYTDYFIVGTSAWGDPTHPNPNALAGRLAW